jgi:hypothetical protein
MKRLLLAAVAAIAMLAPVQAEDDPLIVAGQWARAEREFLGSKLRRQGIKIPPPVQMPINDKLTAEEVFEGHDKILEIGTSFAVGKSRGPDARTLSEVQSLRLAGLQKIHQMAEFVLYRKVCGHSSFRELDEITNQFERLPHDMQANALHRQKQLIETKPALDFMPNNEIRQTTNNAPIPFGAQRIPGGWPWFCGMVRDEIRKGNYDYIFGR